MPPKTAAIGKGLLPTEQAHSTPPLGHAGRTPSHTLVEKRGLINEVSVLFCFITLCRKQLQRNTGHAVMRGDHVYRANRPAQLWLAINNLARRFHLPDEAMVLIHAFVREHSGENAGFLAFVDGRERETAAAREAGAEPHVPFFQLMGFTTFLGYTAHVNEERRLEEARRQREAARSMHEWRLFGFDSPRAYKRAKRKAKERF